MFVFLQSRYYTVNLKRSLSHSVMSVNKKGSIIRTFSKSNSSAQTTNYTTMHVFIGWNETEPSAGSWEKPISHTFCPFFLSVWCSSKKTRLIAESSLSAAFHLFKMKCPTGQGKKKIITLGSVGVWRHWYFFNAV